MPITKINSLGITNPVSFSAGTVGSPSITFSGDTNTGVFAPTADTIAFTEGGSEAMRIDSSGNVCVGTTSTLNDTKLMVLNGITCFNNGGASPTVQFRNTNAAAGQKNLRIIGDNDGGYQFQNVNDAYSSANTLGILNRDGRFLIGRTTVLQTGSITSKSISNGVPLVLEVSIANNGFTGVGFHNPNGSQGQIAINLATVTYESTSDYRLKENVNYNFDATTRLKQLKPARFNFIVEPNRTIDGFIAHEVSDIIPEAVSGTKDQTKIKEKVVVNASGRVIAENIEQADWEAGKIPNEQGERKYPIDSTWEASKEVPVYQGMDPAKLTPLLTKALQEAIAKIEQLEARLTALESK